MAPRTKAEVYPERPQRRRASPGDLALTEALASYARQLYAEGKSDQTIERVYLPRLRAFQAWLEGEGMPTSLEGVRREHIEAYVLHLQRAAPGRKNGDQLGQMPATVSI